MKVLDLGFTSLTLNDNYVIGCTNAGVTIDIEKHKRAIAAIKEHFDDSFGIILDEKNSYDVDFDVMLDISKNSDLVAVAIVSHRSITEKVLNLFVPFVKKPVRFFSSMSAAQLWMEEQLLNDSGVA